MKKPVILAILDGWGIGAKNETNPIHIANPPTINYIKSHYPSGALQASGIAVGLPWEEEGNSEVGHLTLGSGKIIYQHYPKITIAIRNKTFFQNPVLKTAIEHVKANNSAVNLVGILTSGNVHASLEHLKALIKMAEDSGISRINLHLFGDGKDSPPKSILKLLAELPEKYLASLSGRFYAMDRDEHWERTETTYKILTGQGKPVADYKAKIESEFANNLTEEFLEPILVGPENRGIKDRDAVIFFNFREDSMRQITSSFALPDFAHFQRVNFSNLAAAMMTQYSDKFHLPVAFPAENVDLPLAKILSDHDKFQLHIAETEKYAHVTFFFNGFKDAPFKNEYRILIPSQNVQRHDEHPEMKASEITAKVIQSIDEGIFDFIVINFANPDMVAHTGNFEAGVKAIQVVDECVASLMKKVLEVDGTLIITSDHGNVEQMLYPMTGQPETKHDISPVPIYFINKLYERERSEQEMEQNEKSTMGIISDVAPTILEIMKIPQPDEMTGQSLLPFLVY